MKYLFGLVLWTNLFLGPPWSAKVLFRSVFLVATREWTLATATLCIICLFLQSALYLYIWWSVCSILFGLGLRNNLFLFLGPPDLPKILNLFVLQSALYLYIWWSVCSILFGLGLWNNLFLGPPDLQKYCFVPGYTTLSMSSAFGDNVVSTELGQPWMAVTREWTLATVIWQQQESELLLLPLHSDWLKFFTIVMTVIAAIMVSFLSYSEWLIPCSTANSSSTTNNNNSTVVDMLRCCCSCRSHVELVLVFSHTMMWGQDSFQPVRKLCVLL